MIRINPFDKCPGCNYDVFQLFPSGNLRMGDLIVNKICYDCFENLLNDNLLKDCTYCGSAETVIKRETYTAIKGKKKNKAYQDIIHCSECEEDFTTKELEVFKKYREKLMFAPKKE